MIVSVVIYRHDSHRSCRGRPPIPTAEPMYDPTAGVVRARVPLSAAFVLLVVLYRTRQGPALLRSGSPASRRLATAVSDVWPWPWLAPQIETPAWASEPSVMQLSMSPGDIDVRDGGQHFGDTPTQWKIARARMRLTGLQPGWSAGVGLRESSIRVSGREALSGPRALRAGRDRRSRECAAKRHGAPCAECKSPC